MLAETYKRRGDWKKSLMMEQKAADLYQRATIATVDVETVRSLNLLSLTHRRAADALRRYVLSAPHLFRSHDDADMDADADTDADADAATNTDADALHTRSSSGEGAAVELELELALAAGDAGDADDGDGDARSDDSDTLSTSQYVDMSELLLHSSGGGASSPPIFLESADEPRESGCVCARAALASTVAHSLGFFVFISRAAVGSAATIFLAN